MLARVRLLMYVLMFRCCLEVSRENKEKSPDITRRLNLLKTAHFMQMLGDEVFHQFSAGRTSFVRKRKIHPRNDEEGLTNSKAESSLVTAVSNSWRIGHTGVHTSRFLSPISFHFICRPTLADSSLLSVDISSTVPRILADSNNANFWISSTEVPSTMPFWLSFSGIREF